MLTIACAAVSAGEVSYKEGRIEEHQGHDHIRKDESQRKASSRQYLSLAFPVKRRRIVRHKIQQNVCLLNMGQCW